MQKTINNNIIEIKRDYGLNVISYRVKGYIKYYKIVCECGKEFETTLWFLKNSKHIGKCRSCSINLGANRKYNIEDVRKMLSEKNWELLSNEYKNIDQKLEAICSNGHKTTFTVYRFSMGAMCHQCYIESDICKKENHWNWKGGVTSENEIIRKSKKYIKWRDKIFERDNYKCVACGNSRSKILNAHHILNFSNNKKLRFDLNNGITLCEKCHSQKYVGSFHNIYGTSNNTKEQLDEYINNVKILKHY